MSPMSPRLLRPRSTVHPEAASWAGRVRDNGGTVSATTLAAVSKFCRDIDAAGIRDRFYRLNLFCGTGLQACLVPLYRGASLGGTQYGNAADTNNSFVSGDYVENAGLGPAMLLSQNKYLDTTLVHSDLPAGVISSGHLAVWHGPFTAGSAADPTYVGAFNSTTDRVSLGVSVRTTGTAGETGRYGKATAITSTTAPLTLSRASAFILTQRTSSTNLEIWRDGSVSGTSNTSTTGIAGVPYSIYVFRLNSTGTVGGELPVGGPLRGYSIGDDMTSDQVLAFRAAWSAFNTALGRTA